MLRGNQKLAQLLVQSVRNTEQRALAYRTISHAYLCYEHEVTDCTSFFTVRLMSYIKFSIFKDDTLSERGVNYLSFQVNETLDFVLQKYVI